MKERHSEQRLGRATRRERRAPEAGPPSDESAPGRRRPPRTRHTALLVLIVVAGAIHIAGLTILGVMLRESLRLTKAVGALVIQEEAKTRPLFQR